MVIAPETELYLLKCPLAVDEAHQIDFANATAQHNYFASLPQIAVLNLTYQRDNDVIFFEKNIEEIRSYNYVMYKNKQYGNKWFYAFITKMEYENNVTTRIYISTDYFQTYMFDYEIKKSFIVRETVDDDTIGKHLVPENIDYGDYVTNTVANQTFTKNQTYICMMTSESIGNLSESEADFINGIARGVHVYAFNIETGLADFSTIKGHLDYLGKGTAILSLFMIPKDVTSWTSANLTLFNGDGTPSSTTVSCFIPSNTTDAKKYWTYTFNIPIGNYNFEDYHPVNGKMFTFPYIYFYVSNNAGSAIDYKFEDFYGNPEFEMYGCFTQGGDYRLIPKNSKRSTVSNSLLRGAYDGYCESLNGCQMPQLSWESDYYLNWCAMNKKQAILDTTMTAFGWGSSMIGAMMGGRTAGTGEAILVGQQETGSWSNMPSSQQGNWANTSKYRVQNTYAFDNSSSNMGSTIGGMVGSTANMVGSIANVMIQDRNAERVPNSINGNQYAGDITYSLNKFGFTFYTRTIRASYARRIDNYMSMFGYKVNETKVPNLKSRRNWNYIQTIGINIVGNIPQEAISFLKNIYNNGITIWHNPSNIYDYSVNNDII